MEGLIKILWHYGWCFPDRGPYMGHNINGTPESTIKRVKEWFKKR
jgi:hypothetical protein